MPVAPGCGQDPLPERHLSPYDRHSYALHQRRKGLGQVANLDIRFERALSAVEETLRNVEHPGVNG